MKRVALVALIGLLLVPGVASAGSSTDAALGLGAFAVLNQVLSGTGVFGIGRQVVVIERHVIVAPPSLPPVVYAPPPPPVVYAPAPPPPPVVYAPTSLVVVYPAPPPVVVYPAPPPGVVYAPARGYVYDPSYRHYGQWLRHRHH